MKRGEIMIDAKKVVIGGLTAMGVIIAGYRAYEFRKLRKAMKEEQIIEIEAEHVEEVKSAAQK